ncbi:MAG TPA: hypothetical protein VK687_06785 [Bryobacteraceae bacterium]|jgi:hypothetical protein|nr:hypothetical protein [Bryobacteraceae bacterium]
MGTVQIQKAPNGYIITDATRGDPASFKPMNGAYSYDQAKMRLRVFGFSAATIDAALKETDAKGYSVFRVG